MNYIIKQSKMNTTILLDAGHGGCIAGHYQTAGKRSPIWADGTVLYEGEFNRQIKYRLKEMFESSGYPYVDINPQDTDLSLSDRVDAANTYDKAIYISIHANAGGGTGCEVFTAVNCSKDSTQIAKELEKEYQPHFNGERWRGIKKKDFYVVKNTRMPAVLIECFFMDTERECKKYLMTSTGRDRIALWIFTAVKNYIKTL
jgi:N-acetylmuramoyl-L-alanine amidase